MGSAMRSKAVDKLSSRADVLMRNLTDYQQQIQSKQFGIWGEDLPYMNATHMDLSQTYEVSTLETALVDHQCAMSRRVKHVTCQSDTCCASHHCYPRACSC